MFLTVEIEENENKIIEAIKILKGVVKVHVNQSDTMNLEEKQQYEKAKKDFINKKNIISLDEMLTQNGL